MKEAARDETETDLKVIYSRYFQALLDQKCTIGDIHSKQDGKLLRYPDLRPTLAGQRRSVVPILPKLKKSILTCQNMKSIQKLLNQNRFYNMIIKKIRINFI